ncbi:hypothetical protein N665_0376s0017 [Sinapis alba]|nr:hypothetical protein N665_0376s0017 [Sinapis alba]
MRQPPRQLATSLEKMSVYLCEDTLHSSYGKAIITGFFQSVGRNVTNETSLLSVKNEIEGVLNAYGPVLVPYANTLNLQMEVIQTVERICLEADSPFFPAFGYIIQVLSNHGVEFEAVQLWKTRKNKERDEGRLSPREVALLTNLLGTPIGPGGAILQGHDLGQASQDARNMGF